MRILGICSPWFPGARPCTICMSPMPSWSVTPPTPPRSRQFFCCCMLWLHRDDHVNVAPWSAVVLSMTKMMPGTVHAGRVCYSFPAASFRHAFAALSRSSHPSCLLCSRSEVFYSTTSPPSSKVAQEHARPLLGKTEHAIQGSQPAAHIGRTS